MAMKGLINTMLADASTSWNTVSQRFGLRSHNDDAHHWPTTRSRMLGSGGLNGATEASFRISGFKADALAELEGAGWSTSLT